MLVFFFFFQAEDGIRDVAVTGVQTCALPIWTPRPARSPPGCARRKASGRPERRRALPPPPRPLPPPDREGVVEGKGGLLGGRCVREQQTVSGAGVQALRRNGESGAVK